MGDDTIVHGLNVREMNTYNLRKTMENTNQAKEIWQDYQILDEIARDRNVSQRDLARNSGLALGRTNQVVKRLIRKGLVKTSQINAKRVAYYLTPKGFSEKLRLVVEYARITVSLFSMVRQVINRSLAGLVETHNVRTVVIYGPANWPKRLICRSRRLDWNWRRCMTCVRARIPGLADGFASCRKSSLNRSMSS